MATSDGTSSGPADQQQEQAAAGASEPGLETTAGGGPWKHELPERFGPYRIKERLGGGGMGTVYLVENTELQREEALKVPHLGAGAGMGERFLREARLAAQLEHPNLCPVHHVGVIDGVYFLTMRFLKGKPLSHDTGRPQPPLKAVEIVLVLARALEYAHGQGVIHRDLKPSNVMLCPDTGPTIMDFGLAKQTLHPDEKLTQSGVMLGTPSYMPPEQINGELDRVGPCSDVYSLGVILFELLTGRLPFTGTAAQVMAQALLVAAPLPSQVQPGLAPALDAICVQALAKTPGERFASMKAFAAALSDHARSMTATAAAGNQPTPLTTREQILAAQTVAPGQLPPGVVERGRAKWVLVGVGLVLLLGLMVGLGAWLLPAPSGSDSNRDNDGKGIAKKDGRGKKEKDDEKHAVAIKDKKEMDAKAVQAKKREADYRKWMRQGDAALTAKKHSAAQAAYGSRSRPSCHTPSVSA
jgi:hypothetical protein